MSINYYLSSEPVRRLVRDKMLDNDWSYKKVATWLNVNERRVSELMQAKDKLSPAGADAWAIRLGRHPRELWSEWNYAQMPNRTKRRWMGKPIKVETGGELEQRTFS